MMRDC
jgi:hypothetical protein